MPQNQFTRQTLIGLVDQILDILTVAAAAAIPLFFLPVTSEAFFINKHFLMFVLAGMMLVLWTVGFVLKKQVKVTVSPLLLPMFLLAAGVSVSQIFGGGSVAEALIGRIGLYFSAFVIFMVGSSRRAVVGKWLAGALAATAGVLGLASVLAVAGVYQLFGLADYTKVFTPAGSLAGALVVELAGLTVVLGRLKGGRHETHESHETNVSHEETTGQAIKKLGLIAAALLIVSGAIVAGIMMFPRPLAPERSDGGRAGQDGIPRGMPLTVGWQIAIETLKEKPFFGVGTAAYLSAFTKYRPLSANEGDLWNQRFLQAPNEIFQTFTTNGLVGLVVLLFLVYQLYRMVQSAGPKGSDLASGERSDPFGFGGLAIGLLIVVASLLLLPLNVVSLSVLVTLMTALVLGEKRPVQGTEGREGQEGPFVYDAVIGLVALRDRLPAVFTTVLPWVVLVLAAVLSGLTFFLTGRAWAAEISYRQALVSIIGNDGTGSYNKLIQTIQWNPFIDTYHRQYADVNLRLANSLAAQQNLTDQDRINVSQLVQQSIREGKIAVQLDPEDVQNWEILARTYRALINVAQGASDWTLVAYGEAVRRDPVNPLLRLELGGVFYNLSDWESATRNFQAAVNLKPDYANGYYNLALAYEQDGRAERAAQAMQAALSNLRADSADYAAAQAKLAELLEKAKTAGAAPQASQAGGQGELSGPEPLPTPLPGANRVELGEEEQPPVTPTPTAGVSPTPTPAENSSVSPTPEL